MGHYNLNLAFDNFFYTTILTFNHVFFKEPELHYSYEFKHDLTQIKIDFWLFWDNNKIQEISILLAKRSSV